MIISPSLTKQDNSKWVIATDKNGKDRYREISTKVPGEDAKIKTRAQKDCTRKAYQISPK